MAKHVLLIDDDPDDALFFLQALSELDLSADFLYLGNAWETLPELFKKTDYLPDVIFLDINMPMSDGWECLKELKSLAEFRNIPVVMYSTADIESEGFLAVNVGAAAFMTKPTTLAELKLRLAKLMHTLFPI